MATRVINAKRVKDVIDFIELLTVPSGKGEGRPLKLRPFQKRFIRDIYGPMTDLGNRRTRRAILSMARKNGKTLLIAALALVHLLGPEAIRNGEIYSAANDRDQAAIVFKYASQMVRLDAELSAMIRIVDSTKTMYYLENGSVYRAISAEAGTKYGLNPTVVIYDELAQSKKTDLYDALVTSMAAREEPLFIVISTQSNDPLHILSQLIDDGLKGHDPSTVCHLYAVPDDADDNAIFKDRRLWKVANPALGDFRSLDEMKQAAAEAKRMPSRESAFRNLYLNQRVDAESPLISRMQWLACQQESVIIEPKEPLYLGLDLSAKTDLTAMVAVSADRETDRVKAWFWKPEDTLHEHENRDRVPYWAWKQAGYLETTPGRGIEYDWIAHRLGEVLKEFEVLGMAYDRWRMEELISAMARQGLESYRDDTRPGKETGDAKKDADARRRREELRRRYAGALRLVPWGQGYADMAECVDALEVSVLNLKLKHDGHPVLTWNISNATIASDPAGNRKLDKSKTRFRIDGAVALAMAMGLKSADLEEGLMESVYDKGGLLIV